MRSERSLGASGNDGPNVVNAISAADDTRDSDFGSVILAPAPPRRTIAYSSPQIAKKTAQARPHIRRTIRSTGSSPVHFYKKVSDRRAHGQVFFDWTDANRNGCGA